MVVVVLVLEMTARVSPTQERRRGRRGIVGMIAVYLGSWVVGALRGVIVCVHGVDLFLAWVGVVIGIIGCVIGDAMGGDSVRGGRVGA